jgi:hypothetical protein
MLDWKNPWNPSAVDGSGTEGATAPDSGILFPDHGAFQYAATDPASAASDWSDVAVDIDFVDDMLTFASTTAQQELDNSDTPAAPQDETRALSTPLDELSAFYPGIVWPPMS